MNGEHIQKLEQKPKGLPPGWRREIVVRKNGMSAGKTDVYYYSPCGKKFRSKPQIARFLGDNADLTCFDFSRAGSLGDGTRRRARDRNPQGTTKKYDPRHMLPQPVRPLSANPLRPSGPVRRTCGVIKLPVMLLSPPAGDIELRDSVLGVQSGSDQKVHSLNVVVQSLWERRLNSMCPQDHITGKDVTRLDVQATPPYVAAAPRPDSASHQHAPLLLPTALQPQQTVLPSLLGAVTTPPLSQRNPSPKPQLPVAAAVSTKFISSSNSSSSQALTGTRLLQLYHHGAKPSPASSSQPQSHRSHSTLPLTVTDTDVRLQEQRVQLLRQQLMAAQGTL